MKKFFEGSKSLFFAWSFAVVFFAVFIILPLACIFTQPSFADIKEVLSATRWRTATLNTFLECICSTTLSVLVGFIYAYAVERGNIPFRRFFAVLPVIHLVTPPFVGGLAFILLFGKQGFITKTLLGLDVSLYGFYGLLLAQVLCFFPIAYLICSQTLRGISPSVEQAAKSMGAKSRKVFFTVTLPLALPGIASSLLFIAVSVLSDFGNPLIVAGRFRVLAVEIYTQLTGWLNTGISAALGIILLVPSVILFILQNKLLKSNINIFATIGGKSGGILQAQNKKISPFLTLFCAVISLAGIAQLLAIIAGSFQKLWGIDTSFTVNHFISALSYSRELLNSVGFALTAAVLSTVIAAVTSYITTRTNLPLRKVIDSVCQMPSAIPGSLFGLALAVTANMIHFRNSAFLIVAAMTVSYLPFSYRICYSSFMQIKSNLDEGSRSLGAGRLKVLTSIIIPLSAQGLFSSFVYDFVRGVGTLSAVIFLVSFGTPLASVKILNLAEQGNWGKSAALALILTVITFLILGIGKFISSKFTVKLWGKE